MLRLSRDRLIVALEPAAVSWVRLRGAWARQVTAKRSVAVNPALGKEPWNGAIAALHHEIGELQRERLRVTVVLSNHFVRYTMVPAANGARADEQLALARFQFTKVHGERAASWDVRLTVGPAGTPRLASAVQASLLEALKGCFPRPVRPRLTSVQPYLMSAFNFWRHRMAAEGTWLLLVEPDRACLAMFAGNTWTAVQNVRSSDAAPENWLSLLDREKLRSSLERVPGTVLTRSSVPAPAGLRASKDWNFVMLDPPALPGAPAAEHERYAIALHAA